jgi:uroporphyrinogen decarboxylase
MGELLADAGADVVAVVDPMTSQIGPDHFAELCTPHARRIFDRVRGLGLKSSFFVCGHAQKNVEAMCDCGCDNVSIDENIPLDYVRDIAREKGVSFGGNLQLTVVLLTGTPDDNRRNAVECMEIGGPAGYVLAPGCDMPYATPPENVEAIAEIVHDGYARQVARQLAREADESLKAFDLTQYGSGEKVIVDVITLDSEACAPCQYMVESVKQVTPEFEGIVEWREHKIKYRESLVFMTSLMVRNVPAICIDGQITFVSRIPPRDELVAAIQRRINQKFRKQLTAKRGQIVVLGPHAAETDAALQQVERAVKELGVQVTVRAVHEEQEIAAYGITLGQCPAVVTVREQLRSLGHTPELAAVKEWVKQLR